MLTLQFIPAVEYDQLSKQARIQRILEDVRDDRIVIIDRALTPEERIELIRLALEEYDLEGNRGIEIEVWDQHGGGKNVVRRLRERLARLLLPDLRIGFTIIGPATLIKEIKKDPEKVELITSSMNGKRRKKRKKA